jgi:UDP:flavonoid glycosyltransferase YjiC (YdhE family)
MLSLDEHRHQCEVRGLLRYRKQHGLAAIRKLLSNPAYKKRLDKLQKDMASQWRKGNKGLVDRQWL